MPRITYKMIDVDQAVDRLLDLYGLATAAEVDQGKGWYFQFNLIQSF